MDSLNLMWDKIIANEPMPLRFSIEDVFTQRKLCFAIFRVQSDYANASHQARKITVRGTQRQPVFDSEGMSVRYEIAMHARQHEKLSQQRAVALAGVIRPDRASGDISIGTTGVAAAASFARVARPPTARARLEGVDNVGVVTTPIAQMAVSRIPRARRYGAR